MNFDTSWKHLIFVIILVRPTSVQIAFPMYPPPQPMPYPVPVPVPAAIVVKLPPPTTTTTTTTEANMAVAFPVPVPVPVQYAIPAIPPPQFCQSNPKRKNCPVCPPCLCFPSCTPSFFSYCSSCHLKCRCRNKDDAPVPLPPSPPQMVPGPAIPMPAPMPPVYVVPLPPQRPQFSQISELTSSDTSDSSSSSSEFYRKRQLKRRKLNRNRKFRRDFETKDIESSGNEFVKPMLTYYSKDGEVKFKKRLSRTDAAELIGERHPGFRGRKSTFEQDPQVLFISHEMTEPRRSGKKIILRKGPTHILGPGKRELVVKPPENKHISNLSVSFQII